MLVRHAPISSSLPQPCSILQPAGRPCYNSGALEQSLCNATRVSAQSGTATEQERQQQQQQQQQQRRRRRRHEQRCAFAVSRRVAVVGVAACLQASAAAAAAGTVTQLDDPTSSCSASAYDNSLAGPGPCQVKVVAAGLDVAVGRAGLADVVVSIPQLPPEDGGGNSALRGPPWPLAVLASGYNLPSKSYRGLARHLASHGFVALQYDLRDGPAPDAAEADAIRLLIDAAASGGALQSQLLLPLLREGTVDASRMYLIGHSRGAKLCALVAAADERVSGLCLLDPVDNTLFTPKSPDYPPAAPALAALRRTGPAGGLPVCIVAAGVAAADCAPRGSNHEVFFEASRGPTWRLVVEGAGHLSFLDGDPPPGLAAAVCSPGRALPGQVAAMARGAAAAFGALFVRQPATASSSGTVGGGFGGGSRSPPSSTSSLPAKSPLLLPASEVLAQQAQALRAAVASHGGGGSGAPALAESEHGLDGLLVEPLAVRWSHCRHA